jgi:hypothetical protein
MEDVNALEVASYIEALNVALRDGEIKQAEVVGVLHSLPSPEHVRRHLSDEEAKVLFESVRWAWKETSGKDITETFNFEPPPETLLGNYWMLKNGVLLHGVNHYGIVKRNLSMFATLLKIDPFVLHQKLAGTPQELVKLVIDNGGMRIFITSDKRAYFQMNDKVYTNWGRSKVKGLDFSKRVVKLVDPTTRFNGWNSGITLKL